MMESVAEMLEKLATLTKQAEAVTNCLASLREQLSDDQWEALEDSPLDDLVAACLDLEYTVETIS
jgi:type II secretory pathway component PulF